MFIALCCSIILFCGTAKAEYGHHLFQKIAVFPLADANFANAEDAWWQIRETLTKEQRFVVASRRFMINRGVFQPRRNLKPADVIILGKILDAEAMLVTYLENRTLKMRVYESENGSSLWESSVELHPAIPLNDQLIKAAQKLVQDFILAVPYQGYQVIDSEIEKPFFEVDNQKHAWIFHGSGNNLSVGDPVQWIDLQGDPGKPFFNSNLRVEIIGEGKVVSLKGNLAEVQIDKIRHLDDLKENALVRFPGEMAKLKVQYTGNDRGASLTSEYLSSEMKNPKELEGGHHPTATTLAFLGNIALIVLLAF